MISSSNDKKSPLASSLSVLKGQENPEAIIEIAIGTFIIISFSKGYSWASTKDRQSRGFLRYWTRQNYSSVWMGKTY